MKILITGSNSPLGSYFIQQIRHSYDNCKVFALSRRNYQSNNENVQHITHDLQNDNIDCNEKFDIVLHVASAVPAGAQDESEFSAVNHKGSIHLFKNLALAKNATILNISSTSVYDDPSSEILTENSKKTSDNQYGLSKLQFENSLNSLFANTGIRVLTCRLPVLLVKGVQNNFMANWLQQIRIGQPITLFNPESLLNACICGEDIFNFFIRFYEESSNQNLTCNLSSKKPIKVIDAAKLMIDSLGGPIKIIEKQAEKTAQLVSNKLAVENGFKPQTVEGSIRSFVKA